MNNRVDKYGTISAAMEELLNRSRDSVGDKELRNVKCPRCGFKLMQVYGHADIPVEIRCGKCKYTDIINLAFFRTQRRTPAERR